MAFAGPRTRLGLAAVAVLVLAGSVWAWSAARVLDPVNPHVTLAGIEATVAQTYPVPELTDAQLAGRLSDSVELRAGDLLFDVREPDEFAQSHLPGARRIDPDMTASEFEAAYGSEIKGRSVVFYCAVGVRSGRMLARVQSVLEGNGASAGYNLRGGIFRWRASGRTLVAENTADGARSVHAYDASWGQLLDRTLKPETASQSKAPRAE